MSECYDGLEPDLDGHLELQKKLAKEIREGDYVVWDVLKTHTNERKERIVTFSGIEYVRTFNLQHSSN